MILTWKWRLYLNFSKLVKCEIRWVRIEDLRQCLGKLWGTTIDHSMATTLHLSDPSLLFNKMIEEFSRSKPVDEEWGPWKMFPLNNCIHYLRLAAGACIWNANKHSRKMIWFTRPKKILRLCFGVHTLFLGPFAGVKTYSLPRATCRGQKLTYTLG